MLTVLSPAKRLDYESKRKTTAYSMPDFLDEAEILVRRLRRFSAAELAKLYGVSPELAETNRKRFADWTRHVTPQTARQAILAFSGDVYLGLNAGAFKKRDFDFTQRHLRILSGLYGVLRPLDLICPYRLEMGTPLSTRRGRDLYEFWGNKITEALNEALSEQGDDILVNLASKEYFKAVRPKALNGRIVTPVFKEAKGGKHRVISVFAKRARGLMASYVVKNRLRNAEDLKTFDVDGYAFNDKLSGGDQLVFTRRQP